MSASLCVFLLYFVKVARPQSEVVSQKLHNCGRVTVLVFLQAVEVSNGLIESLFGKFTGDVGTTEDLVVKDGVVQSETQSDGVCRLQVLSLV